ncbi:MAG: PAS domain S-box protein [Deltaproteobacteria bacterium]|nr:PAS domain S-box protein [Deltaproteobacteria bacterium]
MKDHTPERQLDISLGRLDDLLGHPDAAPVKGLLSEAIKDLSNVLGELAAARRRSEEFYDLLVNAIPSSILLIDRNLQVLFANRNFLEKTYLCKGNIVGKRLSQVFPEVIIEELGLEQAIRSVFDGGVSTQGQRLTYRAPGVPMRTYYYRMIPVVWTANVDAVLLLMEDVSEQVQLSKEVRCAERHLASVVDSASDIVLSTDTEGRILTWNPAAERISGCRSDDVKGRSVFEYFAREHREDAKAFFSALELQEGPRTADWILLTADGASVFVSWVFSAMKDEASHTTGVVAVGRDQTERRKLEVQRLQREKLAALGVMAGGIAHELRNPLAVCSSAAQFLENDEITPEFRRECAVKIQNGITRASAIIENVLTFARPSEEANFAPLDILAVLDEMFRSVANEVRIQKIELVPDLSNERIVVNGIKGLLQLVFMNLFLNAIKAMPKGGQLRTSVARSGSEVLIRVADTGCGIPKGALDKVFDPFYTTSTMGAGTGLGLSLCYSIVKEHHGSIEVESTEGAGTVFTVRLPVIVAEEPV